MKNGEVNLRALSTFSKNGEVNLRALSTFSKNGEVNLRALSTFSKNGEVNLRALSTFSKYGTLHHVNFVKEWKANMYKSTVNYFEELGGQPASTVNF